MPRGKVPVLVRTDEIEQAALDQLERMAGLPIVRGKGNPKSFESCAHGAGRRMLRAAARKRSTRADLERQTDGVECRKHSV